MKLKISTAATNRTTADFSISSPMMGKAYTRIVTDYNTYRNRLQS